MLQFIIVIVAYLSIISYIEMSAELIRMVGLFPVVWHFMTRKICVVLILVPLIICILPSHVCYGAVQIIDVLCSCSTVPSFMSGIGLQLIKMP